MADFFVMYIYAIFMYNYTIILIIKFKSIFTNLQVFRISTDAETTKASQKDSIFQNIL